MADPCDIGSDCVARVTAAGVVAQPALTRQIQAVSLRRRANPVCSTVQWRISADADKRQVTATSEALCLDTCCPPQPCC